jgi:GntR family transcriptional regulator / MocR family aminotransferase
MIPMDLSLDHQGALYEQIARSLRDEILQGRLGAGSRLPSTRDLAAALGVARKSVLQAYELLCAEQLAVARAGSGTRVAQVVAGAASRRRERVLPPSQYVERLRELPPITLAGGRVAARLKYNLQYGEPLLNPALFNSWRRKLSAAALRAGPMYPSAEGFLPLRRALVDYLARRRGIHCAASDVLIVAGTQQALTLAERVLLNVGDPVLMEDPHYELALQSLLAHGARVVSGQTDEHGLMVSDLPEHAVAMAYLTPSHQFPSGAIMSLARRMEFLAWANRTGCWIFEDDYDTEFHSGKRPLAALKSLDLADRVIYVGSFSKTLFPSLRLAYMVCPKGLRDDLFKAKLLDDLGCPAIDQAALATFIQSGQYEKHLRKSVLELLRRRQTVVRALRRSLGTRIELGPHGGGMHLLVRFRDLNQEQLAALIERARGYGLGLYSVHPYYRVPPALPGLVIGYAGQTQAHLKNAIELLARCLEAERPSGI